MEIRRIDMETLVLPDVIESQVDPAYVKGISFFADRDINKLLSNSTVYHAAFLIKTLLKKCKGDVKIFTGGMEETFYNQPQIAAALDQVLKDGHQITILLESEKKLKKSEFYKKYRTNPQVHFFRIDGAISIDAPIKHFCTLDEKAYRAEKPHKPGQIRDVSALANFNDPTTTKKLNDLFSVLIERYSKPVDITN